MALPVKVVFFDCADEVGKSAGVAGVRSNECVNFGSKFGDALFAGFADERVQFEDVFARSRFNLARVKCGVTDECFSGHGDF